MHNCGCYIAQFCHTGLWRNNGKRRNTDTGVAEEVAETARVESGQLEKSGTDCTVKTVEKRCTT
ncbi:Protein of unknown function [Pyronema omphalodes CBS 100304]|uniref:Uncharacterized protein n=1 Tax=Pyronema omphalodes (strain CBS 100304) TaxID=1076935 RepID=U4LFW5_PYROM|nr:Protein of unknown function [Pyronema omphalodes CBS 100304]